MAVLTQSRVPKPILNCDPSRHFHFFDENEIVKLRPEMKVIYVSGYTDDAVVRLGVLKADMPFLQRSFTPATLARKICEVLDTSR